MMLSDWFPDVPIWIVITAFAANGTVILLILACLVASPIDGLHALQERRFRKGPEEKYAVITPRGGIAVDDSQVTTEIPKVTAGSGKDG